MTLVDDVVCDKSKKQNCSSAGSRGYYTELKSKVTTQQKVKGNRMSCPFNCTAAGQIAAARSDVHHSALVT
jgi:hypothetical protein